MTTDFSGEIDRLLSERRPDRYEPEGGSDWLDDIAAEVADLVPEAEARFRHARAEVGRREGEKTKSANRLLRDTYKDGQWPLGWMDRLHLPIAAGKERVALRAATPEDFRLFATDERRRAADDFSARNDTCVAAEWIADEMQRRGCRYGQELTFDDDGFGTAA